jgi:2-polyprenyl-6-methoxyphenol hydroxylase-like FAD-dependent oxidoreductase
MAGLLAARVLSEYFEQVTILERDYLPEEIEPRKGIPQGRHFHALLGKGASILTELFPDLFLDLLRAGAHELDAAAELGWYQFGRWKARFSSPLHIYTLSRPLLEAYVRAHVAARSNVAFRDGCAVVNLCCSKDARRITGVLLQQSNTEGRQEELLADLVVDASGRGSHMLQWLLSLGYEPVLESVVKIDVGYATRLYRCPQTAKDWTMLSIYPTPPQEKRTAYLAPIEGNRWVVTMAGRLRDYPPDHEAGFLDFARSLSAPDLYEAIKEAEPLTPIITNTFPANQWRHYERLSRWPEGLLVLGDAVCGFNPIYGQGMTIAALEAKTLDACLQEQQLHHPVDGRWLPRRFQQAIAKQIAVPWMLATSEDFRYPQTQGRRPLLIGVFHWYSRRVLELATQDPQVALGFYEVLHMFKPLTALFAPQIMAKVLFKKRPISVSQPHWEERLSQVEALVH